MSTGSGKQSGRNVNDFLERQNLLEDADKVLGWPRDVLEDENFQQLVENLQAEVYIGDSREDEQEKNLISRIVGPRTLSEHDQVNYLGDIPLEQLPSIDDSPDLEFADPAPLMAERFNEHVSPPRDGHGVPRDPNPESYEKRAYQQLLRNGYENTAETLQDDGVAVVRLDNFGTDGYDFVTGYDDYPRFHRFYARKEFDEVTIIEDDQDREYLIAEK